MPASTATRCRNAPKWIANVTAALRHPDRRGGESFVFTDWAYRSEVNFFLYESVEFTGQALLEGGLRVGYSWGNGKYEVAPSAATSPTRCA